MHLPHSLVFTTTYITHPCTSKKETGFTADRHNCLVNAALRHALMHAKHECLENTKSLLGPSPAEIRLSG